MPEQTPPTPPTPVSPSPEVQSVIHSVPLPSPPTLALPSPSESPSPTSTNSTPRTKKFGVFSPRQSPLKPPTPLFRIFSPHRRTIVSTDDHESDSSQSQSDSPRRRRFINPLCCWSRASDEDYSFDHLDYAEQLKRIEPCFEPESPLLPSLPTAQDRICLVLDLDETLVHSSFTPLDGADFEIPLEMGGDMHTVYVKKRPGVDDFLKKASEWFEIVIFTASLALYANPVVDLLDPRKLVQLRLYREHCVFIGGCYVKDIAKLGRDLKRTFIIDNSPLSYVFQPENAIPITAFFTDDNDRELDKTLALLEQARDMEDVREAFS